MKLEYKIDENDFLTYQLYAASKSNLIKKNRQCVRVIMSLIYILFGFFFCIIENSSIMLIVFIIGGFLCFFLYPVGARRAYVEFYKKFIKENFKDKFGHITTLEINDDYLFEKENNNESKFSTTGIAQINEISQAIFIQLNGGLSLILPKDKIENIDNVITRLKELANYLKIEYNIEENWRWK